MTFGPRRVFWLLFYLNMQTISTIAARKKRQPSPITPPPPSTTLDFRPPSTTSRKRWDGPADDMNWTTLLLAETDDYHPSGPPTGNTRTRYERSRLLEANEVTPTSTRKGYVHGTGEQVTPETVKFNGFEAVSQCVDDYETSNWIYKPYEISRFIRQNETCIAAGRRFGASGVLGRRGGGVIIFARRPTDF